MCIIYSRLVYIFQTEQNIIIIVTRHAAYKERQTANTHCYWPLLILYTYAIRQSVPYRSHSRRQAYVFIYTIFLSIHT